jgi:Rieske Fe-S protein
MVTVLRPDGTAGGAGRPADGVRGVTVLDSRCTHRGCVVAIEDPHLTCRCHDSVFDGWTGARLSGPAPSGLLEYRSEVVDGILFAFGV